MADLTVGDILTLEVRMGCDVSDATTLEIYIKRPGGDEQIKNATAKATNKRVATCRTNASDLNEAGEYEITARGVWANGDDVKSPNPFVFEVADR